MSATTQITSVPKSSFHSGSTQTPHQQKTQVSFGRPPVDIQSILRQVIASNIDPARTIREYSENSIDAGATRIEIEVDGKISGSKIEIKSIKITDDGCGMSESLFARNFRGIGWLNMNHHDVHKYGKNCVGAKSGLDYFSFIEVSTTTKDTIESFPEPEKFKDPEEMTLQEEINAVHRRYSKLKTGDPDTERRRYRVGLTSTDIITPWEKCDQRESGTVVYLHTPVSHKKVYVDIAELKRNLSYHFEWIEKQNTWNTLNSEKAKRRKRGLFLKLPESNWESIMPFDNGWSLASTTSKEQGAYLLVTGSLSKGIHFQYTNSEGNLTQLEGVPSYVSPIKLTADEKRKFFAGTNNGDGEGDVNIWLQLTYGMDSGDKQMLTSISGSILSKLPWDLSNKLSMGSGVNSALRGKIVSSSMHLKRSLRHNRTELDMGDELVQKFWTYMYMEVFKVMSDYYKAFTEDNSKAADGSLFSEVMGSLKHLFSGKTRAPSGPQTQSKWVCVDCNHVFMYELGRTPLECPECQGRDLVPYKEDRQGTSRPKTGDNKNAAGCPDYETVSSLGHFIPVRYNPDSGRVEVVPNHPEFTNEFASKSKWYPVGKDRFRHHVIIALTAHEMNAAGLDGDQFLKEHGMRLKKDFLGNLKRRKAVEKRWATFSGANLFVNKTSSSFE